VCNLYLSGIKKDALDDRKKGNFVSAVYAGTSRGKGKVTS